MGLERVSGPWGWGLGAQGFGLQGEPGSKTIEKRGDKASGEGNWGVPYSSLRKEGAGGAWEFLV